MILLYFPRVYHFIIIIIIIMFTGNESPQKLKSLLDLLPTVNRRCLHRLMEVGVRVSEYSSVNLMTLDNIARIYGPNIIRREDDLNPMTQVANLISLALNMLKNYNVIFGPFK